jgi:flagellar basal-body rod modification protein FlgD
MQIQGTDAFQQASPFLPRDTTSGTTGTTGSSGTSGSDQSSTDSTITATDALGNETTFLQLLVAQIQNQDPTQPMDSSTFLTQLASFTQVEQLIGIREDVQQLVPGASSSTSATNSTNGS